ncbi:MAG: DUF2892 domain-containing protein [Bacteroidetes bacterium]|nr:DUF2892 domain-containing protein [Bacteroidota bacterium]MBS1740629.1 DUF2892 domain-containing protein [Bacteroidota bacterium]
MKKNIGTTDRNIRIVLAIIIGIIIATGKLSSIANIILGVVGIIALITAFVRFCPLYFPFGISTKRHS